MTLAEVVRNMEKVYESPSLRHPDPKLTATIKVEYPKLQVLVSWKETQRTEQRCDETSSGIYEFHLERFVFRRLFEIILIEFIGSTFMLGAV